MAIMAPNGKSRKSLTIAAFTALEVLRSRFLVVLGVAFLVILVLTWLAGAAAVTEAAAIRTALLASMLRLGAAFLLAIFVVSSIAREQSDKGNELILSLAIPRHAYFLGKLVGYSGVAIGIAALATVIVWLHARQAGALWWGASLAAELIIIVATSLLCMMTLSQVPAAIAAVAAFYLLARSIGSIQLMAHGPLRDPDAVSSVFIARLVDLLAVLLPDLYRFADTRWLLYGDGSPASLAPLLAQAAIYVVLLSAAGLFDLYRRNF